MPRTAERPKCLVEVAGRSILERLVQGFAARGVKRFVVVAGYQSGQVQRAATALARRHALDIRVVDNAAWSTTNNVYSLWVAREHIAAPFVLVDGDLVLGTTVVDALLVPDRVAVSNVRAEGSHAEIGADGQIVAVKPGRSEDPRLRKTVNAASFGRESWDQGFRPAVEAMIEHGRLTEFYEVAIDAAVRVGAARLLALEVDHGAWTEVDDALDLARAEARERSETGPSPAWPQPSASHG
jgi:choline kinase